MILMVSICISLSFFFSHHSSPTEIYTLSLHDALPILQPQMLFGVANFDRQAIINNNVALSKAARVFEVPVVNPGRSEEHTSELQSLRHLVCRLLLEKKKKQHETNRVKKIHVKGEKRKS